MYIWLQNEILHAKNTRQSTNFIKIIMRSNKNVADLWAVFVMSTKTNNWNIVLIFYQLLNHVRMIKSFLLQIVKLDPNDLFIYS